MRGRRCWGPTHSNFSDVGDRVRIQENWATRDRRHHDDVAGPLSRRARHRGDRGVSYTPAFVSPDEFVRLGLAECNPVRVRSALGSIPAILSADPNLRDGLVSMAFGYGPAADDGTDVQQVGSSPNRLIPNGRRL